MQNILVVSVHPDDETLGCGGTLLKHKKDGSILNWLIITNAIADDGWNPQIIENRQKEIIEVSRLYGFEKVIKLDFPTTRLDEVPFSSIIAKVSNAIKEIEPNVVYINNRSDIHSDHKIAFNAVMSCTKTFRYPFIQRICMYECLSETEFAPALTENVFVPNVFVDITDYIDKKLEIMSVFASEVMPDNLPRSYNAIKALAAYRGSRIGVEYAEAFSLLFEKSS
jgi:N-acetylglucosamine malate deacetylase 1